jgi:iron complex outermembrane recepter protein
MSNAEKSFRSRGPASRRTLLSLVAAVACGTGATVLHAQEAAAPSGAASAAAPASGAVADAASGNGVQTVVVSATRRREPAREVPMQVQAIPAGRLQTGGARTLADYLADEPGVSVAGPGAGQATVAIRGVSTGIQTISTVGTYIDDVAFGSSNAFANGAQSALDMNLLDLNHIEVLRGPQGTLYGAGAMGGLLKYVTNEPETDAPSGRVSIGASTTRGGAAGNTESAVVNVPLKEDVAALRAAVFHDHVGGYVDAVGAAAGKNINGGDTSGGRISLLLTPSARDAVRLTALSQNLHRDGVDAVDVDPGTGRPLHGGTGRSLALREPYSTRVQLASIDIEHNFGWARFNSITSVQTASLDRSVDYTGVLAPLVPGLATAPASLDSRLRKETQEFRLTSASDSHLEWLGGLFWTHESGDNRQEIDSTMDGGGAGPQFLHATLPSSMREIAGYGDLTWKLTPRLALTGGVRVAQNRQHFTENLSGALAGGVPPLQGSSSETSKTYLATASYALTPASNVYLRAASGYRPGGPNVVLNDPSTGQPLAPATFRHDSLWSYEAGYKADLLDKTLALEASVYHIDWHDLQQFIAVQGLSVITNAGNAKVDGLELGARWKPGEHLSLASSLSWDDARLTQDAPGLGRSGSPLPNGAKLSGSLTPRYELDLGGHAAWVGGSLRYIGERHAGFAGSTTQPDFKMPSYWLADLQAGVSLAHVDVSLYVRNVFDRRAIASANTSFVPLGGPVGATLATPRTLGVTLASSF